MTIAAGTAGASPIWYLTRGTGVTSLILLTVSVALGVINVRRAKTSAMPRFVFDAVHRNASLLAVAFIVLHIVTSLLDGYATIRIVDTVVPFVSTYRPLWLGLGAVAFDLLLAVAITSLVRRRLGYRAWRAVHWVAYASWPVALFHGLGTGSDAKTGWMLAIAGVCTAAVIVAVVARATAGWPDHVVLRGGALACSAIVPLALVVWLPSGPLAKGWAKRAGTPASLLASSKQGSSGAGGGGNGSASGGSAPSFTASLSGISSQSQTGGGLVAIDFPLTISGVQLSRLHIRLTGQPAAGGGVAMTDGLVTLGSSANPNQYRGRITALEGTTVQATVGDGNGNRLRVVTQLQLPAGGNTVSGSVTVSP